MKPYSQYKQSITASIHTGFASGITLGIIWSSVAFISDVINLPKFYWMDLFVYAPFLLVLSIITTISLASIIGFIYMFILKSFIQEANQYNYFMKNWATIWTMIVMITLVGSVGINISWDLLVLLLVTFVSLLVGGIGGHFGKRSFLRTKFDYL